MPVIELPPRAWRTMEDEFNRRQMAGEPCDELVRLMTAVLRGGVTAEAAVPTTQTGEYRRGLGLSLTRISQGLTDMSPPLIKA
jgi:hypothetical protein